MVYCDSVCVYVLELVLQYIHYSRSKTEEHG